MNKEVNVRKPSGSSRAKTLWKVRDAFYRGDTVLDTKIPRERKKE